MHGQPHIRITEIVVGVFKGMSRLKRKITVNAFVLSVLTLTRCPEYPQSGSSALSVINDPTTVSPDLAIFISAGTATLMNIIRISCLNTDVMFLM